MNKRFSIQRRIISLYTNLFLDWRSFLIPKVKIDGGIADVVSLEYRDRLSRFEYVEYQKYGIYVDIYLWIFRIGIYFTPIIYKKK